MGPGVATALIAGGAACLWDDLAAYDGPVDGVVACNDAGAEIEDLTAWVSLHPDCFARKGWLAKREAKGWPPVPLYGHKAERGSPCGMIETDWAFPGQEHSGSSGMYAAKVALVDLGFDRAVLCGVPMSPTPHFFGGEPWMVANRYLKRWALVPEEYRERVRSMSGATRDLLGAPD